MKTSITMLASAAVAFTGIVWAPPALAAGESLAVTVTQSTGTSPFDSTDDAGQDSSATNEIVRTNDTVSYAAGVRFEGGDQTHPTLTFTLPKGEELVSLPPFCRPGSTVTPSKIPAPAVPLDSTSWTNLPSQKISCVVADQDAGTALDYVFVARVRPEVPHGTRLDPVEVSATSDQVTAAAVSRPVSHSVSAKGEFDLSKRRESTAENSGPLVQFTGACSFDTARFCAIVEFPLTLTAPPSGKGISPLVSPITVTDDLSPEAFYGAGTTNSPAWLAAGSSALDKYAPRLTKCDTVGNLGASLPNARGGNATNARAVRDNGTVTCSQPALGTPVDITFANADTSAYTVPTQTERGNALPADSAYVLATSIRVEVPMDAIRDLGITSGTTSTLNWHNEYTGLNATDLSGASNTDDPSNNSRIGSSKLEGGKIGFSKGFSGVTGEPGNTPAGAGGYTPFEYEGSPGAGTFHDGNTVAFPGQTVLSNLRAAQSLSAGSGSTFSRSAVMCDVWDDAKLGMLEKFDYAGAAWTIVQRPSGGDPAWVSSFNYNNAYQDDLTQIENLKFEYSHTASPGSGSDSTCDTGTWYDSPAAVPGAKIVDGVWSGVNRVRVSFTTKAGTSDLWILNVSIAMQALRTAGTVGTVLPNWASITQVPGSKTGASVVVDPNRATESSTYDPATNAGRYGDRLILGEAIARIKKYVSDGNGKFTDTTVPQYTAGASVDYKLVPSLTAAGTASGATHDVTIEDCLPPFQEFLSAKRESDGRPLIASLIQQGSPADAELACEPDRTYIRFVLPDQPVDVPIDPIIYTVELLGTIANGQYTNTVAASAPDDASPLSQRTDKSQIQVVVPTGIKIAKSVDSPTIELNPAGVAIPRTMTWSIDFANVDSPENVSDVDVIDVLPADGLNGSAFHGELLLRDVEIASGSGVEVWYSSTASSALAVDPSDPSNADTGSTVWCDAPSGGHVVSGSGIDADCPAGLADVTGLRFGRVGPFTPQTPFHVEITMEPTRNDGGDVYRNATAGRVAGVSQPVGPAIRQVTVVESSIGDRVWLDVDSDGIQDDNESGVADFVVHLEGTDVDGNSVSLDTKTDKTGRYTFTDLASGSYTVTFSPTSLRGSEKFTAQLAGDGAVDSDGDVKSGRTGTFQLDVGTDRTDIDQGVIRTVTPDEPTPVPSDPPAGTTPPGGLAITGGGTAIGFVLTGVLLVGSGLVFLMIRRRARATVR